MYPRISLSDTQFSEWPGSQAKKSFEAESTAGVASLNTEKPYHWSDSTIANILENGCGKIESIVRQISHTLV